MAKVKEKQLAIKLRRQGKSIKDIADILAVSKGSVSLWCQEIILTKKQAALLKKKQVDAGNVGRILGAKMNKQKRLDAIESRADEGNKRIGSLSQRDLLMLGVGLYWGEGVKSRNGTASLVNSDPTVLLIGKKWFQECLDVPLVDFNPYISISEIHKNREEKILKYWSEYLDIPKYQFNKVIFLKNRPKKLYENHDSYYGVVSLRIRKGTDMKYRILGLIEGCKKD